MFTKCATQAWVGCADPSASMMDGSEDVLPLPSQGDGLDEIHRQDRLRLGPQEVRPVLVENAVVGCELGIQTAGR